MYVQARMGEKKRTYDLFISYSRQDEGFVSQLTKRLDAWGYTYWIDVNGIESGDVFKKNIVKAIKASEVVVFVSSKASNESPWTIKEVNYALHFKKPIIPIKIDNAEYNEVLLFDLGVLDYVDCTKSSKRKDGFERVKRTLLHYFPDHRLPTPTVKNETTTGVAVPPNPKLYKMILLSVTYVVFIGFLFAVVWRAFFPTPELEPEHLLTYKYDRRTMSASITNASKDLVEVFIPETIMYNYEDYVVRGIDKHAFSGCSQLEYVEMSNSITCIGDYAFFGCASLDSILVPEGVTIGEQAFPEGCKVVRK